MNQNLFSFSKNSNNIKPLKTKKRTYNEFMESYKQSHSNAFFSEAESLHKSINLKLRKNLENTKNMFLNKEGNNIIKNQKNIAKNDFPQISHQKKGINIDSKKKFVDEEDDIDLIEKDFNVSEKNIVYRNHIYLMIVQGFIAI